LPNPLPEADIEAPVCPEAGESRRVAALATAGALRNNKHVRASTARDFTRSPLP
jgi:hypothetical protein